MSNVDVIASQQWLAPGSAARSNGAGRGPSVDHLPPHARATMAGRARDRIVVTLRVERESTGR
jgi:hypothetical protein